MSLRAEIISGDISWLKEARPIDLTDYDIEEIKGETPNDDRIRIAPKVTFKNGGEHAGETTAALDPKPYSHYRREV